MALRVLQDSCSRFVFIKKDGFIDGAEPNGHISKEKTKTKTKTNDRWSYVLDSSITVRLYIFSFLVLAVVGCDFLCKYWMGFTSLSSVTAIYIYVGSAIAWKILALLGRMIILINRGSSLEKSGYKVHAAVLEDHDDGQALQNRIAEAMNIVSKLNYGEDRQSMAKGIDHGVFDDEPIYHDRESDSQYVVGVVCSNIAGVREKQLRQTPAMVGLEIAVVNEVAASIENIQSAAGQDRFEDPCEEFESKFDDQCTFMDEQCKRLIKLNDDQHMRTQNCISDNEHEAVKDLQNDLIMIILPDESAIDETTSKSSGSHWRNSIGVESEMGDLHLLTVLGVGQRNLNIADHLYKMYTERMQHFDMLNYQYMYAIGIFPSKQCHKKSKSHIIASSLRQQISKKRELNGDEDDRQCERDLETVYIAQTCLSWEVLHWHYKKMQQLAASMDQREASLSYDYVAEQFQRFQVILRRFLENEPFDEGRRIQIYARNRCLLPKLLQVPDINVEEVPTVIADQTPTPVTPSQLVNIMEGAIVTFWEFLKADREKPSKILINTLWKRQKLNESTDFTLLHSVKKNLDRKDFRLQGLRRRGKCVRKRADLSKGEEMEILLGLIDVKIVSRVLRMSRITNDHLRWCQEKLNKLNVSDGKLHRECFPVLFPS